MVDANWTVYVVKCSDGSLYTGCTNDLDRRLAAHGSGRGAAYTRSRRPVRLVFSEPAGTRSQALRREWALKQLSRREKLALIRAARAEARLAGKGGAARRRPPRRR